MRIIEILIQNQHRTFIAFSFFKTSVFYFPSFLDLLSTILLLIAFCVKNYFHKYSVRKICCSLCCLNFSLFFIFGFSHFHATFCFLYSVQTRLLPHSTHFLFSFFNTLCVSLLCHFLLGAQEIITFP